MNNLNFISPRDLEKNNILISNTDEDLDNVVGLGISHQKNTTTTIGCVPINNFYNYESNSEYFSMSGCPIIIIGYSYNENTDFFDYVNFGNQWTADQLISSINYGLPVLVYIIQTDSNNNDGYSLMERVTSIYTESSPDYGLFLFRDSQSSEIYINNNGQLFIHKGK